MEPWSLGVLELKSINLDSDKQALKEQKAKLKGSSRHDPVETLKYQTMKLKTQYDIDIEDDTVFSTKVYNQLTETKRHEIRSEQGRGKHKRKSKKHR